MEMPKLTALISAFDKDGTVEFARGLAELGFDILASAGTAAHLQKQGIKATDVATIVGPPILDHRVVTLSREIHAGLLAQDTVEDRAELERLGIPWIDVLYVNLYPLEKAIGEPNRTVESVTKSTDIGGPTMLRSAAKGRRVIVCNKGQLGVALSKLRQKQAGTLTEKQWETYLFECAYTAEFCVAHYALASGRFLRDQWTANAFHNK
jgi:phosphoribosylaminoimidazolecarboxamide formyltransferase/IMP cyclohydrolase